MKGKELIKILKRFPENITIAEIIEQLNAMPGNANLAKNSFEYKSYGRIYCQYKEDISIVKNMIRNQNLIEFDEYYPAGLVTTYAEYPLTVYIGKFECNYQEIIDQCAAQQIIIFCYNEEITGE